jgi:hypothetical protein
MISKLPLKKGDSGGCSSFYEKTDGHPSKSPLVRGDFIQNK